MLTEHACRLRVLLSRFEDLDQTPPISSGQRAGLGEENEVADAGAVRFDGSLDLRVAPDDFAVHGGL